MTCTHAAGPCPCGTVTFPWIVCNAAGLPGLAYRTGDFVAYRHRLLQALPGEQELTVWRPGATGDLAVQMVEWWAYLADILTFYNERIANEAYLGTAVLPESVNHLVQTLGYRPRPALGAKGTVAAMLSAKARLPVALPQGLQIQSKPGPGQAPQVFELDQAASVTAPDVVQADIARAALSADGLQSVWLRGKVGGIKVGERLLLIDGTKLAVQTIGVYAWVTVTGVTPGTDAFGAPVTQVGLSAVAGSTFTADAPAAGVTLLRSGQSSPLWTYPGAPSVIGTTTVELAGIARGVDPGSLVLIDVSDAAGGGVTPVPVIVTGNTESVWYANGSGSAPPVTSPPTQPIAILHATLAFTPSIAAGYTPSAVTVRWGWALVGTAVPALDPGATYTGTGALVPQPGSSFPASPLGALVEDPAGNAASAGSQPGGDPPGSVTLTSPSALPDAGLALPLSVFFNLLPISRGKTVPAETLGSGNPTAAGQDFTLQQSPVTYFADPGSVSGDGFSSTVTVTVNGLPWSEVQSFYGQKPNAQVFVTHEDDQQQTHVTFGDGVNGALLPSGVDNIAATYRYGAGAAAPAAETLTVVLNPQPGLKGVRNPMLPIGGADADPPAKLSTLAPRSVLTFDRAVSLDDYAAIAATAGGVTQAVAAFAFDPAAQRPLVTLWVAGDNGARAAAQAAIARVAVPYQGLRVKTATPIEMRLRLDYVRQPGADDTALQAALTKALLDPDAGVLGTSLVGIGQPIYDSQIAAACLGVAGVTAIRNVSLTRYFRFTLESERAPDILFKFQPLPIKAAGCPDMRYEPGAGAYFVLPDDGQHLTLSGVAP